MGEYPSADDELIAERITALHTRFKEQRPPYVDFALWATHGQSIFRKVKTRGCRIDADGTIGTIEITGPPSNTSWEMSDSTFATRCIMLDEIKPARLESYKKLFQRYHDRYRPQIGAILDQADVRARLEHTERVRRRGQDEHDATAQNNGFHPFDLEHSWNWVYGQLAEHGHAFLAPRGLLARSGRLAQMVDQDSPVTDRPPAKRPAPAHQPHEEPRRHSSAVVRQHTFIGARGARALALAWSYMWPSLSGVLSSSHLCGHFGLKRTRPVVLARALPTHLF